MALTIKGLVENRLLSTKTIIGELSTNLFENTTEEIMAVAGYEGKKDEELSILEKSYLADLIAAAILHYSLDRYKEDAKSVAGPDSMVREDQNKLAYLQEQLTGFEAAATQKAGKLGLGTGGGGYIPPAIGKSKAGHDHRGCSR
jgi:hypothetical protein